MQPTTQRRSPGAHFRRQTLAVLLWTALLLPGAARAAQVDLAGCVKLALARNPQILDAIDAELSARLTLEVAEVEYDLQVTPTIDGGLQGSNTTNQNFELLLRRKFLPTGTQVDVKGSSRVFSTVPQVSVPYFSEARVTVAQPLLQGWTAIENRSGLDEAERRLGSSEHAIEVAREETVFQIVRAYYEVVRAEQLLEVARRSRTRVRALKDAAEARLELGKVSKMDVYRADIQEARVLNTLADQEARRAGALDNLKLLLGLDPRVDLQIDPRLQGPTVTELKGVNLEDQADNQRPEVREARAEVADSERKLVLAKYGLWPALDLVGHYAQQGFGESFGDSFNLDRTEWNVGFRSSVPLDRTIQKAALTEAEIALRSRERNYRQLRGQVVGQVRQAVRQLDRARAESELAARIATQASQQEELARYRYEKGLTDNFDLVQAEEQLTEARAGQILATIDQAVAAGAVRRATGTLTAAFLDLPPAAAPAVRDTGPPPGGACGKETECALGE
ncbi:MAG: TolC family protein [Candidatus Binatia bacterium]|nr:TolC family protein [Candidatus Binatia bacterium]